MDVSPKAVREKEIREKMRGYHPEDVDQFLEEVANSLEVMQDRLRQAMERAQRAEQAASDVGGSDDTLRRTLVLAQRTADLAVQEARDQATRLLAGAEQQAQSMLSEADERARRTYEDGLAESRAELARLEESRQKGQSDVEALSRWTDEHRQHLLGALQDAMAMVERAGKISPAPTSQPLDVPGAGRQAGSSLAPTAIEEPGRDSGPATTMWHPNDAGSEAQSPSGGDPYFNQLRRAVIDTDQARGPADSRPADSRPADSRPADSRPADSRPADSRPADSRPADSRPTDSRPTDSRPTDSRPTPARPADSRPAEAQGPADFRPADSRPADSRREAGPAAAAQPGDQALDDFFSDDDEFGEDRRFGGRLRRRR